MELAAAALGSLLRKLGSLLTNEYRLQKAVRGEIRFLQAEMESMQAALECVSKLPADKTDGIHKIWARDLKELVYDIEDSVDAFMVRIDTPVDGKTHSFRRYFDRIIGLLTKAKHRHQISNEIQEIKNRIQEVSGRRERYKFENIVVHPDNKKMDPRLPSLYVDVKKLVGTETPAKKLIALLMRGEGGKKQQLLVVSIVGVGGLGKTSLAHLVYQRIRGQFQSQAFVSVSLKPEINKIFSSILRQVSGMEYPNDEAWDQTELIAKIRQILEKNRYIIVFDDIWSDSAWIQIKCALIENNLGSKVIVTTRNVDVAKISCSPIDATLYELDPLSYEDSKRLLYSRVYNEGEEIHPELEEVSRNFLKKCGGVPLAIITIAGLLASRHKAKYEWYSVYKSMGSGLEKDKTMENMREILHLSYCDLPSYLKPCLLYLSMFPEDHMIPRYDLVLTWVAEGFVDEKQGSNLYDIAKWYFNELVNRSMIQPVNKDENGNAKYCRVHDMILDLIISLSVQENFVTISEGSHLIAPACKIRRLSLQGTKVYCNKEATTEEQAILPSTVNVSQVRSLIASGDTCKCLPPLSRFAILRVLSLTCFPGKRNHVKDLGSLLHLRYLKLGGKLEVELLKELGNLQHLKALDLFSADIEELPASIIRLRQLECLIIPRTVKVPNGIENLMSLELLRWLNVEKSLGTLVGLGNLIKLQGLGISGLHSSESCAETFLQGLSNLGNLRRLSFRGHGICSLNCMPDQWQGHSHLQRFRSNDLTFCQVPRWFSSLSELSNVSIRVNLLRQGDLELLGALPVLCFLKLQVDPNGTTDKQLVVGANQPFRCLTEFVFYHYSRCWLVFAQGVSDAKTSEA